MRLMRTDRWGNPISSFHRKRPTCCRDTQLFNEVKNRQWEAAIRCAKSYPYEVLFKEESSGNTPLHIACKLDPPACIIEALGAACSKTNDEGATPLHIAASNRCSAKFIAALLKEGENQGYSPAAALTRNGRAPIHCACYSHRGLSFQAFQVLVEASIKTTINARNNALQDLMEDNEYSQFEEHQYEKKILLKNEAKIMNMATLRDLSGQIPLGLLFRRYRERVRTVINEMEKLDPAAAARRVKKDLGDLWGKASWMVIRLAQERAKIIKIPLGTATKMSTLSGAIAHESADWAREQFFQSTTSERLESDNSTFSSLKRRFRIVHASVALTGFGCPPEMIRLALTLYPNQIAEMDDDGNLPIHICASAPTLGYNDSYIMDDDDDCSFMSEFSFFTTVTTMSPTIPAPDAFDKVFKILLRRFPKAAQIPHGVSGELPLTLALDQRAW
eukprot:CAMPEP_0194192390 /NCGR_PEP_ID=MMETSP0154-20130528/70385_1 /TAXON_ID=1049557 /ORGANISM="Thalassiothrix antarctica, Strain L6-D1" /LENGTH=445 /DNA_ID=CAMNT_0038915771 /DNA_START=108 /DNA_END=1442 /DNA_ORIENTATION=-